MIVEINSFNLNGLTFIREFSEWFEGIGYNLWIGTKRGPRSYVEWRIKEHNSWIGINNNCISLLVKKMAKVNFFFTILFVHKSKINFLFKFCCRRF